MDCSSWGHLGLETFFVACLGFTFHLEAVQRLIIVYIISGLQVLGNGAEVAERRRVEISEIGSEVVHSRSCLCLVAPSSVTLHDRSS